MRKILKLLKFGILFPTVALLLLSICLVALCYFRMETVPIEPMKVSSVTYDDQYLSSVLKVEKWLKENYLTTHLPSISLAVGVKGELVWAGAIGYADVERGIPASVNSKYEIASISKLLTTSALAVLYEKNFINLDSSFHHYVNEYSKKAWPFTLKQLASHQAGIRGYHDGINRVFELFHQTEYSNTREAASIIELDDLLFKPGTNFKYSTYGYTLIALAMERATGLNYNELMDRYLLNPLKMNLTKLDIKGLEQANRTKLYYLFKERVFRTPDSNKSYKYAGAGYLSTPSDLVRLGNGLLSNQLIEDSTKQILWTPVEKSWLSLDNKAEKNDNYALGFKAIESDLGLNMCHGGSENGSFAYYLINIEHEIVVAFTSNARPISNKMNRIGEMRKITRMFVNP